MLSHWVVFVGLVVAIGANTMESLEKGNRSLSSFANKSEHQVQGVSTRIRRSVHEPYQPCFTHFFLNDRPPSGFRADLTNIRYICQQIPIHEATFYATMFDIEDGIAVYSAYYITPQNANNIGAVPRQGAWREEPGIPLQGTDNIYANQPPPPSQPRQKGHLVPAEIFSFDVEHMISTFKYTNAVPQFRGFNAGQWSQYEARIRHYARTVCGGQQVRGVLYLLTGTSRAELQAQGGPAVQRALHRFPNNANLNIVQPNSMWTAGCCLAPTGQVQSFAVIGNNVAVNNQIFMSQVTVAQLQNFLLTGVGGARIDLFPGSPCALPANDAGNLPNPPPGG